MPNYRVLWMIKLEKVLEASSEEEAIEVVSNIDCQHDGTYVEDSFDILSVEEEQ